MARQELLRDPEYQSYYAPAFQLHLMKFIRALDNVIHLAPFNSKCVEIKFILGLDTKKRRGQGGAGRPTNPQRLPAVLWHTAARRPQTRFAERLPRLCMPKLIDM